MKPEEKRYILENRGKRSISDIARHLGLRERNVRKFLEEEKPIQPRVVSLPGDDVPVSGPKGNAFKMKDIFIFVSIVAVSFFVRWIYLNQIKTNPFFVPFFNGLDDFLYDNWAKSIAQGDVLGKEVFYGLPLYPYFLGLVYWIVGHNVFIAKAIQLFIGAVSAGLVYLVGRRVFNRPIGIIAAVMMSFCGMSIYFEGFFVSTFLAVFLNCLIILLFLSIWTAPSGMKFTMAGILTGIASLANASVLIFIPFAVLWTFQTFGSRYRSKVWRWCAIMAFGVVLAIAPVTIRNYIVGEDFVPVTSHGGITFYAGNNPLCDGSFHLPKEIGSSVIDSNKSSRLIAERATGRDLKPSEVSKFWFDQGLGFITHEPYKYIGLTIRKIFLFWNAYEIPDVMPMFFFKQYAPLLRLPLFDFAFIAPFALVGMFLCIRRRDAGVNIFYYFVLSVFISNVMYFVNTRYKLIAVPVLAVFAAVCVYWIYQRIRQKDLKRAAMILTAVLVLAAITHVRILTFRQAQAWNNLGIALKQQGMLEDAEKAYKKAIEDDPDYETPYYNIGILYLESNRIEESIENFDKAIELNPDFAKAYKKMGMAYMAKGDRESGMANFKRSLEIDPDQDDVKQIMGQ